MNGRAFKLGTFAKPDGKPFAAIVLDDSAIPLADAAKAAGKVAERYEPPGFARRLGPEFRHAAGDRGHARQVQGRERRKASPRCPPSRTRGKMFYAAQNFQEHVDEMLRAGMTPKEGPKFTGEKSTTAPYLFLKAPSCLAGANDDIAAPLDVKKIDWEAEIACRHHQAGQRVKAERALDHVAGWMTTNDVSATRPANPHRPTGPALRLAERQEPRQVRADGPVSVCRRRSSPDHMKLFIRLSINGDVSRTATPRSFIFTPEEQIEYALQHP